MGSMQRQIILLQQERDEYKAKYLKQRNIIKQLKQSLDKISICHSNKIGLDSNNISKLLSVKTNNNVNKRTQISCNSDSDYNIDDDMECDPNSETMDDENISVDFEENKYSVSVHCHFCKKYFDDIYKYREHIQDHYENDVNKEWLICD